MMELIAQTAGIPPEQIWEILQAEAALRIELIKLYQQILLYLGVANIALNGISYLWTRGETKGLNIGLVITGTLIFSLVYLMNYIDLRALTKNPDYWILLKIMETIP